MPGSSIQSAGSAQRLLTAIAFVSLLTAVPITSFADAAGNQIYDPELFGQLRYRLIGPYRGGRVTAVAGVADQPYTFYFGSTGGGVWKTDSAGLEWRNISDDYFGAGSIGAIAVAPSDSSIVFAGTGSACPRGNISVGDGIYRSTDAGASWDHVGLKESGQIARIVIHPSDPNLVYVAALGHIFGPNEARGVYRSQDGGRTWERVLHVATTAGAVDLALDSSNPRILYASIWRAERKPWTLIDGGEESGLFRSNDGGDSWIELTDPDRANGLPSGVLGRIGVTISPVRPHRIWALIAAPDNRAGLYRSDDGGERWRRLSDDPRLTTRGWYYTHVHAHPTDADTVFVNNVYFLRSIDGGHSFEVRPVPHGDNHDLWINPLSPEIMIQANDGGANVTLDGGQTWSTQLNQPTAEFYRVTVDNQFPFRVYGAQQDNSTISVPSWSPQALTPEGLWYEVGGGESGHIAVHPEDPNIIYAGSYIGRIDRFDRQSGHARNVVIYPEMQDGIAPRDLTYRFQWNAPIRFSPHDPRVLYHTSNRVHRSQDGGMNWETISPDLTRDEPEKQALPGGPVQYDHTGVEVFNTIFSFEESPHEEGVLWAGADDGLVHLSRDHGVSWQNITPPGMPLDSTVNSIALSPHEAGKAFLAVHRYRMDDFRPYIWRTDDYGANWALLTSGENGIPDNHPVRAIREDPDRRGLLYAGTEFGMFVSFDDGAHWQSLQLNLPVTPITDLAVHRQSLVVATQGRSFWILDDLTHLHQIDDDIQAKDFHLFRPPTAVRLESMARFRRLTGPEAPDRGVTLYYWLHATKIASSEMRLEILDSAGNTLRTFRPEDTDAEAGERIERGLGGHRVNPDILPRRQGLNRLVWDLKHPGPDLIEGSFFSLASTDGYYVLPGAYSARLTVDEQWHEVEIEVVKDPRVAEVTAEDLVAQNELIAETAALLESTHDSIRTLRSVRDQLNQLRDRLAKMDSVSDWSQRIDEITLRLAAIEEALIQTGARTNQDLINLPPRLDDQVAYLYSELTEAYGRPTRGSYERLEDLRKRIQPQIDALREIWTGPLMELLQDLRDARVPAIWVAGLEVDSK